MRASSRSSHNTTWPFAVTQSMTVLKVLDCLVSCFFKKWNQSGDQNTCAFQGKYLDTMAAQNMRFLKQSRINGQLEKNADEVTSQWTWKIRWLMLIHSDQKPFNCDAQFFLQKHSRMQLKNHHHEKTASTSMRSTKCDTSVINRWSS